VKRALGDGLELDDAKERIDLDDVHRFLADVSYWAKGRPRAVQERLVREATRVVGLYDGDRQVGFCRAVSDGASFVYLADVYVLEEYRGRGLGEELVREMVEHGPFAEVRWLLHTTNMHRLYRKFGFTEPDFKLMQRPSNYDRRSTSQLSASG
jgi:ribosomal protein S18 acetylase RimI-like enzyme